MKMLRTLLMIALTTVAIVAPAHSVIAADEDLLQICIGTQAGGLGAPSISFTLFATPTGTVFQLTGRVVFTQPVAPPANEVTYAVSGTAIPNADGFFLSLVGTGYDVAKTVFVGMIGMQLSADPANNTLTYAKQSLDAATTQLVTRVPVVTPCPTP